MKTLPQINLPKKKYLRLGFGLSKNPTSIVILDPTIPDSHHIASGIKPGTATYILESRPNAIEQISTLLAQHTGIETLHIITHGSPGNLYLGTTELNSSNIENYSQQLQQWRKALSANASIILYGCNVAAGETGRQFLTQLHQLTGANIAANTATTGNSAKGGTWDIPQLIPPSPQAPQLALTETTLKTYSGVLGFAPKVDFATGSFPRSVSIGDINGDGKPDLALANYGSSTASILLNTTTTGAATPTFAPKVDFTTGTSPRSVSIGDFNGDGKPDLALANYGSSTASILLNTTTTGAATPTFATKVDFTTGTSPRSVSIGDFNGDGKPDLALANYGSSTASILLNTTTTGAATPTFATKVDFTTGSRPYSVSIGDFNGDGKPDLATANYGSNNASILLNTTATNATTPTFATKVDFTTGSGPFSVSIGDINGDGKPDLAVVNLTSNTVSILLNTTATGATTPTFATKVDFTTGTNPISVSIGDINGDGKPDLAVTNFNSSTTSILLNTTATGAATPTFATKVDFTTGSGPYSVSIGDINGDGKPDLAVANRDSSNASILLNTTPKVTAVTATTADGSYKAGSTIAITVTFDAAVNVTGTPQLQLETGTTDQFATYISGSGGTALTFNYVVQAGDTSGDLEYISTTALTLNGGTIKETVATAFDAFLTLPTLATANSLGGSKAIVVDTLAPTIANVTSTTANGSYNTNGSINATVNFSEAVTLAGGNMTVALDTGGTVTITPFSGTSAVGTYTPAAGQNSTDLNSTGITLAGGATLKDAAGNDATLTIPAGQSLADSKDLIIDTVVPTVALTSASPTTTNAPFSVTATFSESVTGFSATGVNVANGTVSGFTGSGTTYDFTVTPTADGNVTVDVPAAKATDTAGNNNTAATQLTRTADVTAPTVALTSASPTTTNAPFSVTATFSESVTGFSTTGVNVANGTVSGFTGSGTTYNFTVTPTADGNVTVDVPAALATDTAGNNNTAATQLTRTADVTAPTVALTSASPTTTNAPFSVTATFSESVTGFSTTGVNVANGTVSGFTGSGTTYNFTVTPTADGNVTVDVPAALATDTAGNNNTAATQLTRTADVTAPTVALTSASPTTTNAPFSVTATFSESVTGFSTTGVNVANGTVSGFTGSGTTYNFTVTPNASGAVTVDVPAAKATDTAGNNNTAATQLTRTADVTAPTANLGAISNITTAGGTSQTLTVTFTDNSGVDVSSLDNSDLVINWSGGAIPAQFVGVTPAGNGTPRTATYSFIPPGGSWDNADNATYTVNLQASQVKDASGNFAAASSLGNFSVNVATPTPAPVPTPTPAPVPTPTPAPVPTPTPAPVPTPTPAPVPTPTPAPVPTPTPAPVPTPTPAPVPTPTPAPVPTPTPAPVPTPTPAPVPTPTPAPVPTPTPSVTPTPTTNNIPNDDCICDDIAYPNLNQPNAVENTILGVSGIQIGTAKNDEFLGSNSGNILDAKSGNDNLYGGESRDIFNGNQGNDFISGGKGDDILYGDEGNDIIIGEFGSDLIFGGKGNDSLNGKEGNDVILGNKDDDFIDGGKDNDTLFGGKGNDIMLGSEGDDYLFGNQGSDTICGGEGNDLISGNEQADILGGCEGNDTIYGGEDNDTLTGCQGDDILYGDLGNDSLIGGSGNDIFVLKAGQGFDIIADFTSGQDLIGLSGGLSFSQLGITQNSQGTLIKNVLTGEELGVMVGVSASAITSANFMLV